MNRYFLLLPVTVLLGGLAFFPAPRTAFVPEQEPLFFAPPEVGVSVLFVGDIMLDRNVARSAQAEGVDALFASTSELFADADIRVGNLEGTITTNPSIAQRDHTILRFTFAPAIAEAMLKATRLDVVSLANNHAYDFGKDGYIETKKRLDDHGVASFGHPYNVPSSLSATILFNDKKLCFVGYHSLFDPEEVTVIDEISALRPNCWRIFVVPHWGEEYTHVPRQGQVDAAHAFIDAGADAVIGSHPHVVQSSEIYRGKAIFYSLGNFMFDQNFSWATTHGTALRLELYEEKTLFRLIPISIKEQHVSIAVGDYKERILGFFDGIAEFQLP